MSNKVKFENVKLFAHEVASNGECWYLYSVGVSGKKANSDEWLNSFMNVKFKKGTPNIKNGTMVNLEGFLTVQERKDKNGNPYNQIVMQVMDYELCDNAQDDVYDEVDSFAEAEAEIPF